MIQDPKKRTSREEEIFQILHDVQDAEFDIDIVDMGLIYGVHFDDKKQSVIVDMTFTSMSCPAMDFMSDDVVERLILEKDIKDASIKIAVDSTKKVITTSIDKSKLDTLFQKNLDETKEELKKINS